MTREIQKTAKGVKISFTGDVQKQNIVKMVENCATGQCECMSDETKVKIKDMQVSRTDGAVELELSGDIQTTEIKEALAKLKILNKEI